MEVDTKQGKKNIHDLLTLSLKHNFCNALVEDKHWIGIWGMVTSIFNVWNGWQLKSWFLDCLKLKSEKTFVKGVQKSKILNKVSNR